MSSPDVTSAEYHPSDESSTRRGKPVGFLAACVVLAIAALILAAMLHTRDAAVASARTQVDQANAESAHLKADLATANAKSAGLQTQLDQVKGQQADLQTQVTQAQGQAATLQKQLTQSQTELRSQQAKFQAQASDAQALQAQVSQAKDQSAGLRKQLDQANAQTQDLQGQLTKAQGQIAQLQPLAAKARVMPVVTTFKKAFWGSGFTLHVQNLNSNPLALAIKITGSDKTPSRTAIIPGGGTLDIPDLAANANVVLSSSGFDPVNLVAQQTH